MSLELGVRMTEHAVIVHFSYSSTDLSRLFALEGQLQEAISRADVGEYDGNEIAKDGSEAILFMYGPDADRMFDVVEPILKAAAFMKGARVRRRYGAAKGDAREMISTIDP